MARPAWCRSLVGFLATMRLLVEAGNERGGGFAQVIMGTSAEACLSAAAGYSLRICLIRAIASSTACSGPDALGGDAHTRVAPHVLLSTNAVITPMGPRPRQRSACPRGREADCIAEGGRVVNPAV